MGRSVTFARITAYGTDPGEDRDRESRREEGKRRQKGKREPAMTTILATARGKESAGTKRYTSDDALAGYEKAKCDTRRRQVTDFLRLENVCSGRGAGSCKTA